MGSLFHAVQLLHHRRAEAIGRLRPVLGLAVLLLVAGIVVSRPLARTWHDGLPLGARAPDTGAVVTHGSGDTLQLYYFLWLARDGLVGSTPFLTDPYQFRTDGPRSSLVETFPPLALVYTLFSWAGAHAAYNLLIVLSFPFSGLAAYLLVRHLTGHAGGAAIAGAIFALLPARLGPLFGGHPAGFAAALPPVVVWGLDAALTTGRLGPGIAGGAALLALVTIEPQYTYLLACLAVTHALVRALGRPRGMPLGPLVAFAALAAVSGGWLWLLRVMRLTGSMAAAGRSIDDVRLFSAGPAALLMPATYGGLLALALALVGVLARGGRDDRRLVLFYAGVLVLATLLSVGPTLPGFPLYKALHRWMPLFGLIRNPDKLRVLASIALAVLVGFGVRALLRPDRQRAVRAAGLAVALLAVLETAPWHAIVVTRLPDNRVYAATREAAGRALYLPIWPGDSAWSSRYLYHTTHTRVPMVNGYSAFTERQYAADVFEPLQGLNVGDLGPAEYARLRALGVTHVVVDQAGFPPQVSPFPSAFTRNRLASSSSLAPVASEEPLWLFRLTGSPPAAPPPATSPVGFFREAERLPRSTGTAIPEAAASAGQMARAREGQDAPGFLMFGGYALFPSGAYRALFRTRGAGLTLEVVTDRGQQVVAARLAPASREWVDTVVPFALDRAKLLEFRAHWQGNADGAVDWVLVVFADRPDPEWSFEAVAMPNRLGEQADPAASGGRSVAADPRESEHAPLLTGPSRLYPAGRLRLGVRARAETMVEGPLLELMVAEPAGRILARRTVDGAELPPGGYRDVTLDFDLTRASVLEFPVWYLGGTMVHFDRVTVAPR